MRFLLTLLMLAIPAGTARLSLLDRAGQSHISYISYAEAGAIVEALREALPEELRRANPADLAVVWPDWIKRHDSEIRARLAQGDEESLVNLLLFGTSFTAQPRVTIKALADALSASNQGSSEAVSRTIQARARDLASGIASPGGNERLAFARRVVESRGYALKTSADRQGVAQYLLASLDRVLNERAGYARVLESAKLLGNPTTEFAERSRLFEKRGLSSDTSVLPNLAIERALTSIKAQGLLRASSVKRVAVLGPGLDFTDKEDGYDFYPQQTIQPFAVVDTLLRLNLAGPDLKLTTFDLSPRVNDHLAAARKRAARGIGYVVQLPRNAHSSWKPETIAYWERLGERIGVPVTPAAVPAGAGDVKVRAVRIRPAVVRSIVPYDLNIVAQRMELRPGEEFDLIVATNILVYYDVFDQSLALKNVERMLRPGGLLLSNNALLELPGSAMRSVGYETVVYSDMPGDGDHIVWYRRSEDRQ